MYTDFFLRKAGKLKKKKCVLIFAKVKHWKNKLDTNKNGAGRNVQGTGTEERM